MRAIKFRAWNGKEWLITNEFELYSLANPNTHKGIIFEQYVGLKDRNGKEIYEGDVVKVKDEGRCDLYEFDGYDEEDESLTFEVKFESCRYWILDRLADELENCEIEIIGNIHENPDLL